MKILITLLLSVVSLCSLKAQKLKDFEFDKRITITLPADANEVRTKNGATLSYPALAGSLLICRNHIPADSSAEYGAFALQTYVDGYLAGYSFRHKNSVYEKKIMNGVYPTQRLLLKLDSSRTCALNFVKIGAYVYSFSIMAPESASSTERERLFRSIVIKD